MKLGDYIDLDRQLHLDPCAEDAHKCWERDRKIGRTLKVDGEAGDLEDEALLLEWKRNVSSGGGASLGMLVEGAVRWTAFFLVLLGLSAGTSAAAVLLRYDGTQPINVLFFLGAIVGVQLLLLPLLVLTFVFRTRLRHGFRLARDFVGGVLTQVLGVFARFGASPEKTAKLRADFGALRAGNSLYARVQSVLVLLLVQVFGVAFNIAVVVTLLFFVLFSDLTFSWATTVRVEPEQIHRITSLLSAPWAGLLPQARPSLELVEATRYLRMEGEFAAGDPDAALIAGGWWPFLVVSTVVYGLLPRLLAFLASLLMLRSEMRRSVSRSAQVQALKERLATPLVEVDPDPVVERESEAANGGGGSEVVEQGLSLAVVFWAYDQLPPEDAVSELLRAGFGAEVENRLTAGEVDAREEETLAEVKRAKEEGRIGGVALFFEPFEPPKADARRFLRRIRDALGPASPIVLFLVEFWDGEIAPVDQADWEAWEKAVRAMGDPYLFLSERLVTP